MYICQVKSCTWILWYLDTWSGLEAVKTAPWPSLGLYHFGKFLEPSDECCSRMLLLPDGVT